jgi:hypothetical protein
VGVKTAAAFASLARVPDGPVSPVSVGAPDPTRPTAVLLVSSFGGLGLHTLLNAVRLFPRHFQGVVFVCVGVIDSGRFKGPEAIDDLRAETEATLAKFVEAAKRLGLPAASRAAVGTDPVEEAERVCLEVAKEYPGAVFFAGQVVFPQEGLLHRLLHNQTALAIQRRLQWAGQSMVILPARVAT